PCRQVWFSVPLPRSTRSSDERGLPSESSARLPAPSGAAEPARRPAEGGGSQRGLPSEPSTQLPAPSGATEPARRPAEGGMSAERATVLYDIPGPRARRVNVIMSVVFGLLLAALLWWVISVLYDKKQLTSEKWSPFLEGQN